MKTRVLARSAWLSFSRHTAASSEVSVPTMRFGKAAAAGILAMISRSTAGASLQPQPPPGGGHLAHDLAQARRAELAAAAAAVGEGGEADGFGGHGSLGLSVATKRAI